MTTVLLLLTGCAALLGLVLLDAWLNPPPPGDS